MPDAPGPAVHDDDSPSSCVSPDGSRTHPHWTGSPAPCAASRSPSSPHGRLREELHGRSLGHALRDPHRRARRPLDERRRARPRRGERSAPAAQRLVGLGVLAVAPTALTGLADYLDVDRRARRVGAVHAALNSGVSLLYGASWLLRRGGRRRSGVAVSLAAYGLAGASAFLGGHLAQALREPPAEVALGDDDVPDLP